MTFPCDDGPHLAGWRDRYAALLTFASGVLKVSADEVNPERLGMAMMKLIKTERSLMELITVFQECLGLWTRHDSLRPSYVGPKARELARLAVAAVDRAKGAL